MDPDGRFRCIGHSQHPTSIAKRAQAGAKGGWRKQAVDAPATAPERPLNLVALPPPKKADAPFVDTGWQPDLSTPQGIREALTRTAQDVARGRIELPQASTLAQLARAAIALEVAAPSGGDEQDSGLRMAMELTEDEAAVLADMRLKKRARR